MLPEPVETACRCLQVMANVDHARWQSWSAFSWLAMKRLARPHGQSRSSSLRPICWDWWCTDWYCKHLLAAVLVPMFCYWHCAMEPGRVSLCGVWELQVGNAMLAMAPWLATSGDAAVGEWYRSRRSMTCLARQHPVLLDASGCFWMLDISGPCKFHHFPKSHWSSAERQDLAGPRRTSQDLAGPRRTSQVCTVESSLPSWAMVGKSRPQLAETKN